MAAVVIPWEFVQVVIPWEFVQVSWDYHISGAVGHFKFPLKLSS